MEEGKDQHTIPITSIRSGKGEAVSNDVFYYTNKIVNVIMIGEPHSDDWVLIDAGMPNSGQEIQNAAEKRFGKNNPPKAIILTHGHFDHVGGIIHLLDVWNTTVYAHPLEFLYLTGEKRYPEPDDSVEGGMLAKFSSIYPIEPINIKCRLNELPENGSVPGLPEWKWYHVPGHAPGQIALFREKDRFLIAGDTFTTVKQDSLYKVLIQKKGVYGPPVYLTTNWEMAQESAEKLQQLEPEMVITGHGEYMEGTELTEGLLELVRNFEKEAIPSHGKFVRNENKKTSG
ncbi:MBL fold metallo-hydrolase [Salegentibacter salinarum]|uniref:MBL fold metallo-hydrolase n=1 Tax=Salegentibacter salinarum TaxID=447422 RepID=A0A2N0TN82_9FLAO|nr:MBL fold metallo-hydrolase [Salegentibacter salinarum]PKD16199.1 MBL fold metallo-hydrolase [Salegentibacter salinarum]SKB68010.1 Glyoxylase, beta-lactamase superfamily II [Salegentibacter salinarum]